MKIAVIGVKGLPANQGGIEHYCQVLYPKVVERGHKVDLFARSSYVNKPWFAIYQCQGVRIICLPSLAFRGLDALTSSGLAAIVAALKGYDVVHFHALGPSLFSFVPRLFSSAKIITTCQGLDWKRGKWGKLSSSLIFLGEKMAAKYAHHVIVVSQALKNYFKKTYDVDTAYIPNGPGIYAESDPNFSFVKSLGLETGKYLLFLGRLVPEKRPELLIEAFQQLEQPDWKLVLAGGNSDTTDYIAQLLDISNQNPNIIFAGELKGRYLSEMVRGAGMFVLPSDLEGLPLAMLEAMREGIPILASDIPPHKQLIGEDSALGGNVQRGLLFNTGSIQSCAEAINQAINQPEQLAEMGQKAKEHVKANYNWEKITTDNLSVYAQDLELNPVEKAKPQGFFNHQAINPQQDNRSYSYGFLIKRGADIIFSASALLLLALPTLVLMILIKIDSPGSIFFTQQRIGLGRKEFKLFKFRTMVKNASSLQSYLENENEIEGGVLFKIREDPRITRVGKFLRRYSIDELPQLVNVLKGDMSIVGPRPLTLRDFSRLSSNQYQRHDVLPGITGLWQVKGRSGSKSKKLHVYDFFYVNRWSLRLDLMILFQTILVVVAGKGA